jgi:hypothetical protein
VCKDCSGSSICKHDRRRSVCKDCSGSSICKHGRKRNQCKECSGSSICEHGCRRSDCRECLGEERYKFLCKSEWCTTYKNRKYEGYCRTCFMRAYPDKPVCRNYKIKEQHIVDRVKERFPEFTWVCDKRYDFAPTDCASRRRPDMYCNFGTHILIVEIDENQHRAYDTTCDNKRLCELYQDFGHIPVVFVRFNPDDYINTDGTKVTSCFGYDKASVCTIKKCKVQEFENRIRLLCSTIEQYTTEFRTERPITQDHMFYDKNAYLAVL